MLLFKHHQKQLLFLLVFLLYQAVVFALPQARASYPELELYRRTLSPEQVTAYQNALEEYNLKPHGEKTISDDKVLNLRYKKITELPDTTYAQMSLKSKEFYLLSKQASKKKCVNLELESLLQAFKVGFWSETPSYTRAFEMAILLEGKLSGVSEEAYPDKRAAYFALGEAYYLFNDYEKSIELLRLAITDNPPRSFTDRANLDARKIIGICYANIHRMDSSDYYFLSTLRSKDMVLDRPVYNAIALSHLACNAMLKGEYQKSLELDLEVLPFLRKGDDYGHVAGMYACQCFAYFGMEEASRIALLADSVLYYARKDTYNKTKRLKQAYTILAKYNAALGDVDRAQEYNDSLVNIYREEAEMHSSLYIAQARQNIAENEIAARRVEVEAQRKVTVIIFMAFMLSVAALLIIVVLYRRTQAAYRSLVRKNQEWAGWSDEKEIIPTSVGIDKSLENVSKEDLAIMSSVFSFVVGERQYASPGINLELLSEHLGINRKYLSKAINSVTGKNFNAYINEYRIKEAIRLLSDPENRYLSVDEIGLQSGFSNRTSFYESFRKTTGITPSQFKKTKRNMSGFED